MIQRKVIAWAIITALGGFLFGFDTAVISGAEQAIQKYWSLTDLQHGFTISIALIGTVTGALFGRIPADSLGRKKSLIIIAFIFLFASLGTAVATNWYLFVILRFMGGLGVGVSSVIAPIYISEIAPAKARGRLVILFQFNIVFGILISYLSNYVIGLLFQDSWRLMLGIMAIPSFIFLVLLKFVPESPRWLILHKSQNDEARETLRLINPDTYQEEMDSIINAKNEEVTDVNAESLFNPRYRFPTMLAVLFAFFNQVSGINAIIYYAPRIFTAAGLAKSSSLLSTAGIGLVNLVFTMIAIGFIDKIGRKQLMLIGSFGLILTLGLVSYSFYGAGSGGFMVAFYLMIYIAFFAFSQGAVIWVFISEIFPNQVRAKGQTLGSSTHWVMATIIAFSFPYITGKIGESWTFLFFTVMMVLQLIFVWKVMPETKGKSLEQIEHTLTMH
ncbi:sugar porter family MFS transporter [Mucilaginibacter sp. McL0603]|uniref:sugar porter family MFS transporter n=1 Tax=Mucilaginibacter sp. McL0603 TaxID=3415670 RepID=UPI003CFADD9F